MSVDFSRRTELLGSSGTSKNTVLVKNIATELGRTLFEVETFEKWKFENGEFCILTCFKVKYQGYSVTPNVNGYLTVHVSNIGLDLVM